AHVDLDGGGDRLGQAAHLDGVGHHADRAAALDPRRLVGVRDPDRDGDPHRRALAEPHEIHVQRQVAHRVELKVTGNDAVLHAVDFDVVNGGEKVSGVDALAQLAVVKRDRQRLLAVAVDDSGYAARAALG